jgi:hypothetical protein
LSKDVRIAVYEGRLIPGRWLRNLVECVHFLPDDVRLVFIGEESNWWKESVNPLLMMPEISRKTLVMTWVPHSDLLNYVVDADVGIIIYDDQVRNNYLCEPGKLSDYVLAGVPVVAPNFPTIAPIVHRYAIGTVFLSPEPSEIARSIIQVLSTAREDWQPALTRAREKLIWETQVPALFGAVIGKGLAND